MQELEKLKTIDDPPMTTREAELQALYEAACATNRALVDKARAHETKARLYDDLEGRVRVLLQENEQLRMRAFLAQEDALTLPCWQTHFPLVPCVSGLYHQAQSTMGSLDFAYAVTQLARCVGDLSGVVLRQQQGDDVHSKEQIEWYLGRLVLWALQAAAKFEHTDSIDVERGMRRVLATNHFPALKVPLDATP